jgi:hypothetical protein
VDVSFTDVTAAGGSDYDDTAQVLNFAGAAGETQTFTVSTTDDALLEGTETYTVNLSASDPNVDAADIGTGTILDNDTPAVTIDDVTALEGDGLQFTVTLDTAVAGAFTVDVSFTDVTATGGSDYLYGEHHRRRAFRRHRDLHGQLVGLRPECGCRRYRHRHHSR